jgi:hypothetical protein
MEQFVGDPMTAQQPEQNPRILYRRLDNGIEIYDAEYYNQPMIDFARNMRNAFLVTGAFIVLMVIIFVVVPFMMSFTHSLMCSVPNWPVVGGCP